MVALPVADLLVAQLRKATLTKDTALITEVYDAVCASRRGILDVAQRIAPEVFVLIAETALECNLVPVAAQAVAQYFEETVAVDADLNDVTHEDQFTCRAHYAKGRVTFESAKGVTGDALHELVTKALKHVVDGLNIAVKNSRHAFLVYNGSVHHWRIARELQRGGTRHLIVDSQKIVVDMLSGLAGERAWRAHNLLAYALCLNETGKPDDALKTLEESEALVVAEIEEMVGPADAPKLLSVDDQDRLEGHRAFLRQLLSAKAHISAATGKPPAAASAGGAAATSATGHSAAARAKVQSVRSALSSGIMTPVDAEAPLREAWVEADAAGANGGTDDASPAGADLGCVAIIAFIASKVGLDELAAAATARAAIAQGLQPRLWADLAKAAGAETAARKIRSKPGILAGAAPTPEAMRLANEALTGSNEALIGFLRINDAAGAHDACALVWDACLPLIGHASAAKTVRKNLELASSALGRLASPMRSLRARMLLEMSRIDAADDTISRAYTAAKLAETLDTAPEDAEKRAAALGYPRALDAKLAPLTRGLELRGAGGGSPNDAEEEAQLLVAMAANAKDRGEAVRRAYGKMLALSEAPVPPDGPSASLSEEDQVARRSARIRHEMWCTLATAAARTNQTETCFYATECAVGKRAPVWRNVDDADMVRLALESCCADAECAVVHLKAFGLGQDFAPEPLLLGETPDFAASLCKGIDVEDPETAVMRAASGFRHALTAALELPVEGGMRRCSVLGFAARCWNTYMPLMTASVAACASLVPLLDVAFDSICTVCEGEVAAPSGGGCISPIDIKLLCQIAVALAESLERRALLRVMRDREEQMEDADALASSEDDTPTPAADDKDLEVAAKACKKTFELCAKMGAAEQPRSVVEAISRLRLLQGRRDEVTKAKDAKGGGEMASATESRARAVSLLEALSFEAASGADDANATSEEKDAKLKERMRLLSEATDALAASGSPPPYPSASAEDCELWVRLAETSLACGDLPRAIRCARAACTPLPSGGSPPIASNAISSLAHLTPSLWRWLALAESVCGDATNQLADGEELVNQDPLRVEALNRLEAAVRYAEHAKDHEIACRALQLLWNAGVPLAGSDATRHLVRDPLLRALDLVAPATNATPPHALSQGFLSDVYCLLLECARAARWSPAQCRALADRAFKHVRDPVSQRALWEARARTEAYALGPARAAEMFGAKLRDVADAQCRFRAWSALAEDVSVTGGGARIAARWRALGALEGDEDVAPKAETLIDVAEAILKEGHPGCHEKAEDCLLAVAADLTEADERMVVEAQAHRARYEARQREKNAIVRTSSAATSKSSPSRRASVDSPSHRKSSVSGAQGAAAAAKEEEMQPPLHPLSDGLHAAGLRAMIRVYLVLARTQKSRDNRLRFLLVAQKYAVRMCGGALAANDAIPPFDLAGWVRAAGTIYAGKNLMRDAGNKGKTALGPAAIGKPELLLVLLAELAGGLCVQGHHLHAMPVRQLASLIAGAAQPGTLSLSRERLYVADLLDQLGLTDQALNTEDRAGPLEASDEEERSLYAEVARRKYIDSLLNAQESGGKPARPEDPRLSRAGAASPALSGGTPLQSLRPFSVRDGWLARGTRLVLSSGRRSAAIKLLRGALEHSRAFEDTACEAEALLRLAQAEVLGGDSEAASKLVADCRKLGGSPRFWCEQIATYTAAKRAGGANMIEAHDCLSEALEIFEHIIKTQPSAEFEVSECAAELYRLMVQHRLEDVQLLDTMYGRPDKQNVAVGMHLEERSKAMAEATKCAERAVELEEHCGGGYQFAKSLLFHSRVVHVGRVDGRPEPDRRPRLRRCLTLLAQAEEECLRCLASAMPKGSRPTPSALAHTSLVKVQGGEDDAAAEHPEGDPSALPSLPVARLLAEAKTDLALIELDLGETRRAHKQEDLAASRPAYPTGQDGPSGDAAVEALLDNVDDSEERQRGNEARAMLHASDAVGLAGKSVLRAPALVALSRALAGYANALVCIDTGDDHRRPFDGPPTPIATASVVEVSAIAEEPAVEAAEAEKTEQEEVEAQADAEASAEGGDDTQQTDLAAEQDEPEPAESPLASYVAAEEPRRALANLREAAACALDAADFSTARETNELMASLHHVLGEMSAAADAACSAQSFATCSWIRNDVHCAVATKRDRERLLMVQESFLKEHTPSAPASRLRGVIEARGAVAKSGATMIQRTEPRMSMAACRALLPADVACVSVHVTTDRTLGSTTVMACIASNVDGDMARDAPLPHELEGPPPPEDLAEGEEPPPASTEEEVIARNKAARERASFVRFAIDEDAWSRAKALAATYERQLTKMVHEGAPRGSASGVGSVAPTVPATPSLNAESSRTTVVGATDLEATWRALVDATTQALLPIAPLLELAAAVPSRQPPEVDKKTGETVAAEPERRHVILLIGDGTDLAGLPLEALPSLAGAKSLSRDVSAHILAMRYRLAYGLPSDWGENDSVEAPTLPSDMPGVTASSFAYICDAKGEETPESGPYQRVAKPATEFIQNDVAPKYGKDWSGLVGTSSALPSTGQVQKLLMSNTSRQLLWYGPGRMLQGIDASTVSPLSLGHVCFAGLFEHAGDDAGLRQRRSMSNRKAAAQRDVEESAHASAALLGARGVWCTAVPLFLGHVDACADGLNSILGKLSGGGAATIGEMFMIERSEIAGRVASAAAAAAADGKSAGAVRVPLPHEPYCTVVYGIPSLVVKK